MAQKEPKQPCVECGNDYAEGYCPHGKKPKRAKKKSLGDHAEEFSKKYKGGCTLKKRCSLMSAALSVAKEDGKPLGLDEGMAFSTKGEYRGTEIIYHARRAQYALVVYCPFCGGKVGRTR